MKHFNLHVYITVYGSWIGPLNPRSNFRNLFCCRVACLVYWGCLVMLRYRFSFPLCVTYFAFLFSLFASYFTAFASVQDDIDIIIDKCKALPCQQGRGAIYLLLHNHWNRSGLAVMGVMAIAAQQLGFSRALVLLFQFHLSHDLFERK